MTQLMVARRDGVIRGPGGELHRVHKGKTLADARHPAVQFTPQAWMPMEVALPVDEPAGDAAPGAGVASAEALAELADARAEAADYLATLTAVADLLTEYGYTHPDDDEPGWLPRLVRRALTLPADSPALPPDDDVIPPPRAARSRARARATE